MDVQACYEQLAQKLRVLEIHKRKITKPGVKITNSLHATVCHSEMHRHILSMWSSLTNECEEFLASLEPVEPPVKRVQRSTVEQVANSTDVDILA
jgi:hypothetical protein